MKKALFLSLLLALLSTPAMADEPTWQETCASVSSFAATVMERRLDGIAMARMIEVTKAPVLQDIVIDAYTYPRMMTEGNIRVQIQNFRDKWYLMCVKSARDE